MTSKTRVLSLQPYFGGSHQQFHEGWVEHSSLEWTTLTLPARNWKWRMRHASIYFAEEICRLASQGQTWDAIVCTDMLNVAEFKGLVETRISQLPLILYFHENQFAYPIRNNAFRDQHFPFTNFVSALAADRIWFNSQFNYDSMLAGLSRQSGRWPDFPPNNAMESLATKLEVQAPGIEIPPIDLDEAFQHRSNRSQLHEPLRIAWAARWEHDKNPAGLLEAFEILDSLNVDFELNILGQSFQNVPPEFNKIKNVFQNRIRRWGFQPSRAEYWQALAESDVFISIANHEFFGLAAAEAIAVGLNPLLPHRLAYPELIGLAVDSACQPDCFFEGSPSSLSHALHRLSELRTNGSWQIAPSAARRLADRVGWHRRAKEMDDSLRQVVFQMEV